MYDYIKGTLVEIDTLYAVIDAGGIGYKCLVPANTMSRSITLGKEICLYVTLVVRENFQGLYGFLEKSERACFEMLILISGVGPKTALSLLGHLNCSELNFAIEGQNINSLSKVPGIGKKTAERLIVELKGKLGKFAYQDSPKTLTPTQKINDALGALMNLGYTQSAAQSAVKKVLDKLPEDCDLSTLITAALKVYK
jgi:Holliday junction DNA helicase RuvA